MILNNKVAVIIIIQETLRNRSKVKLFDMLDYDDAIGGLHFFFSINSVLVYVRLIRS